MMDIQVKWDRKEELLVNLDLMRKVLGLVATGKTKSELDQIFKEWLDHFKQQKYGYGLYLEQEDNQRGYAEGLLIGQGILFLAYVGSAFTVGALRMLEDNANDERLEVLMCKSMFYTGQAYGTTHGTEVQTTHWKQTHAKGAAATNAVFNKVKERFLRAFAAYKQANQWKGYSAAVRKISMQAFKDGRPFLNPKDDELLSNDTLIEWAKEHDKTGGS